MELMLKAFFWQALLISMMIAKSYSGPASFSGHITSQMHYGPLVYVTIYTSTKMISFLI